MSALLAAVQAIVSYAVGGTVGDVIIDTAWSASPATGHQISWIGNFVHALVSSDILMVGLAIGICGLSVGLITRFLKFHS